MFCASITRFDKRFTNVSCCGERVHIISILLNIKNHQTLLFRRFKLQNISTYRYENDSLGYFYVKVSGGMLIESYHYYILNVSLGSKKYNHNNFMVKPYHQPYVFFRCRYISISAVSYSCHRIEQRYCSTKQTGRNSLLQW